uniref:C-type lectin domain-containing protein n=1 Tax=Salarias fasciatus TaxID=181472 RepID=A0A672IL75_SALFA
MPISQPISHCSDIYHQKYHYFNHKRNWTEAQRYCRKFYNDLATFESMDDIDQLNRPTRRGHEAWIGLYREPWMWSDGSNSSFRNWISWAPDNQYTREHCGMEHPDHRWDDQDCSLQGHFICQGETKQWTFTVKYC